MSSDDDIWKAGQRLTRDWQPEHCGWTSATAVMSAAIWKARQAMQKWDYKVAYFTVKELEAGLKQLGTDGWELVTVHFGLASTATCVLKRPVA